MRFEDRAYQQEDIEYGINHGPELRPIHCIATGGGKTYCQAKIAEHEFKAGNAVGIITPREEIFRQTHSVLGEVIGYQHVSKLMAGEHWRPYQPVHVISWDTLIARVKRSEDWFPNIRRLIVDEAHLSLSPLKDKVLRYYAERGTIIDGYTATPARKSGKGLGDFYTNIKNVITIRQLIKQGYLAPCEYWGAEEIDVTGVRRSNGDYVASELAKASAKRHGDVVDTWGRLASDRHTIVFAVNVADCEALTDRFRQAGVRALALHSALTPEKRRQVVNGFKAGAAQVLVNVGIASYGFDDPSVDCVMLARPTASVVLWLQMIGRGMRPAEGKEFCMVIDHTGGLRNPDLGYADELRRWRLDKRRKATKNWSRDRGNPKKDDEEKRHQCGECGYTFARSLVCPKCGWTLPLPKQEAEFVDANIVRLSRRVADSPEKGWPDDKTLYLMLMHYALQRGYKPGWAAHKYHKKLGKWPAKAWRHAPTIVPNVVVANWARSEQIRFAKKRKAANG